MSVAREFERIGFQQHQTIDKGTSQTILIIADTGNDGTDEALRLGAKLFCESGFRVMGLAEIVSDSQTNQYLDLELDLHWKQFKGDGFSDAYLFKTRNSDPGLSRLTHLIPQRLAELDLPQTLANAHYANAAWRLISNLTITSSISRIWADETLGIGDLQDEAIQSHFDAMDIVESKLGNTVDESVRPFREAWQNIYGLSAASEVVDFPYEAFIREQEKFRSKWGLEGIDVRFEDGMKHYLKLWKRQYDELEETTRDIVYNIRNEHLATLIEVQMAFSESDLMVVVVPYRNAIPFRKFGEETITHSSLTDYLDISASVWVV